MTNEESKKAYDALDSKLIDDKSGEIMMEILLAENASDKEVEIFDAVKAKFTLDELAYIACLRIGLKTKAMLELHPEIVPVIKMARMQERNNDMS